MDNDLKDLEAGTYHEALHRRHNTTQNNTTSPDEQPAWASMSYLSKSGETARKSFREYYADQRIWNKALLIITGPIMVVEIIVLVTADILSKNKRRTEAIALVHLFIIVAVAWFYFASRRIFSHMSNRGRMEVRRILCNGVAALVVFGWVYLFVTYLRYGTFLPLPTRVSTASNATAMTNTTDAVNSTTTDS